MPHPSKQNARVEREVREAVHASGEASVLIFPAISGPVAHLEPHEQRRPGHRPKLIQIAPPDVARASEDDQLLGRIAASLTTIVGSEPTFIGSAQAFEASVNRQTLEQVAAIKGIELIRLNRNVGKSQISG